MPTSNVRQLLENGVPIYPITDKSLVIGLQDVPFESYVVAWDGASTPVVANIPAGVVVTYNTTDYTGTLAAGSATAPYLYLVASASQQGEYDRYIVTHTGSTYAWTQLGSTAPVSPVIADNLTTNDASKALSAKQGKILGEEVGELEAKVTDLEREVGDVDIQYHTEEVTLSSSGTEQTTTKTLSAGKYTLMLTLKSGTTPVVPNGTNNGFSVKVNDESKLALTQAQVSALELPKTYSIDIESESAITIVIKTRLNGVLQYAYLSGEDLQTQINKIQLATTENGGNIETLQKAVGDVVETPVSESITLASSGSEQSVTKSIPSGKYHLSFSVPSGTSAYNPTGTNNGLLIKIDGVNVVSLTQDAFSSLSLPYVFEKDVESASQIEIVIKSRLNGSINFTYIPANDLQTQVNKIKGAIQKVYNVKDFGAVGDGEADDTAAIQAAVDYVNAYDYGGTIYLPVGIYILTSNISWKSGVNLLGESRYKSILKTYSATAVDGGFSAIGAYTGNTFYEIADCSFENFCVDGSSLNVSTYGSAGKAIYAKGVTNCTFKGLELYNTNATALGIDGLSNVVIDDVHCVNCGRGWSSGNLGGAGIGIGVQKSSGNEESLIITNCVCDGCGSYGIFLENQVQSEPDKEMQCIICDNIVKNGRNAGIAIVKAFKVSVSGNIVTGNTDSGISVRSSGNASWMQTKNILIQGNEVLGNGNGIMVEDSLQAVHHIAIIGNYVKGNDDVGIGVGGLSGDGVSVAGNIVTGNDVGVKLNGTQNDFTAKGNIVYGNTTDVDDTATFTGETGINEFAN